MKITVKLSKRCKDRLSHAAFAGDDGKHVIGSDGKYEYYIKFVDARDKNRGDYQFVQVYRKFSGRSGVIIDCIDASKIPSSMRSKYAEVMGRYRKNTTAEKRFNR